MLPSVCPCAGTLIRCVTKAKPLPIRTLWNKPPVGRYSSWALCQTRTNLIYRSNPLKDQGEFDRLAAGGEPTATPSELAHVLHLAATQADLFAKRSPTPSSTSHFSPNIQRFLNMPVQEAKALALSLTRSDERDDPIQKAERELVGAERVLVGAERVLVGAQGSLVGAERVLAESNDDYLAKSRLARELVMHYASCINRLTKCSQAADDAIARTALKEEVAAAKKEVTDAEVKVVAAKKEVTDAKKEVTDAEVKVAAAKKEVSDAVGASISIIEQFERIGIVDGSLTRTLPFGMLGRDGLVERILYAMEVPADKFPPILLISTSRAGKTLMLETLKRLCNADRGQKHGVYVVTCSLNGTRLCNPMFPKGQLGAADINRFYAYVLNLLLFGSTGNHQLPQEAKPMIAWPSVLTPVTLCNLIRKKHDIPPNVKLLLAVDEITTIFDQFPPDCQSSLASMLGALCNRDSRLLLTGFTRNSEKSFLGVSKRVPIVIELPAVTSEDRFKFIPLMTGTLLSMEGALKASPTDMQLTATQKAFVYCVIHEALKSSPGLMGTVVENLVYGGASVAQKFVASLESAGTSMWGVLSAVSGILPDRDAFNDRDYRSKCLTLLDKYLTARYGSQSVDALDALMPLNLAAPGRLDVFRVIMVLMCERRTDNEDDKQPMKAEQIALLPRSVQVLMRFLECYEAEYKNWQSSLRSFSECKGAFFEIACRSALELECLRMQRGICPEFIDGDVYSLRTAEGFSYEAMPFSCPNYPINQKSRAVDASPSMFVPCIPMYPVAKRQSHESNPLVDLILNIPVIKDGVAGLVQVWVQVKHTPNIKPLTTQALCAAMSTVAKYNNRKQGKECPVMEVVYLLVGPNRQSLSIVNSSTGDTLTSPEDHTWRPTWSHKPSDIPLTVQAITTPYWREQFLGSFISQLVPDFDQHDCALELPLEKKIEFRTALNRVSVQGESDSQRIIREELMKQEDDFHKDLLRLAQNPLTPQC